MPRKHPLVPCERPNHPLFKDLTGRKFERLSVIDYAGRIGGDHAFQCRCDCGGEIAVLSYCLTSGATRSCGCLLPDRIKETKTTHGLSQAREFRIWSGMKNRCYNPTVNGYQNYGGLGVTVCERWLTGDGERGGFECFYADVGPRPSDRHSIDRINTFGNYEPGNCRWATQEQQQQNRRDTPRITWRGETRTLTEWAQITELPASEISKRLRRDWSVDRALTQPLRASRR